MQMNNIPFGWKVNKLGNVVDVFDGTHQTPEYVDHGIKFISAEDISDPSATTKYITHQAFERDFKIRAEKNDVFMTRIGRIGIPFLLKTDEDFAYYVTLALLKLKRGVVPEYLFYFIQSNYFQFELWKRTLHVAFPEKINKDEIGKCLVLYPNSIAEQKKIAEILGTWDRAIEELNDLISEKKELKRGLMQRLLTGSQRLPGFTKPWEKIKMNTFLREISEKTTLNNQYKVLSVTKNGVCSQEDYFEKQIASENNIGYKILRKHNLVFSPMNLWMGSLGFSDYDIGIVSPAYKIFIVDESVADYRFLKYFMVTPQMIYMYKVNSEIGASIVRRNLDLDGLLSSFVRIPDFAEQKAIADVLSKADAEIDLLNQQLDVLKEQKRGLMQKLLTGEIRVKVDTETC